jgi:WD40 repeat protein
VVWRDWIVAGHDTGQIEIWDITHDTAGKAKRGLECIGTLDPGGRAGAVCRLGVSGGTASRLVSAGSTELRVWVVGSAARTWACERTIEVQQSSLFRSLLAVWGDSAATAHYDTNVRVWDLDSGECRATLRGHQSYVFSVGVDSASGGQLLVTLANARTLRVWEMRTWTCTHTLTADIDVRCVAVSGGKIFGGLTSVVERGAGQTPAVLVWDLQTLQKEGTLWMQGQNIGSTVEIDSMVVDGGELWALSREKLTVWGWKPAAKLIQSRDVVGKRWGLNAGPFFRCFSR